jgi:hypothetical protein
MTLNGFALKHKLKLRWDKDDEADIIPGKHDQSQMYEDEDQLAVMFITPAAKPARTLFWRIYRDLGIAAGMTPTAEW